MSHVRPSHTEAPDYRARAVAALHAPGVSTILDSLDVMMLAALAISAIPTERQIAKLREIEHRLDGGVR